jgi:hypothetical protein
MRQTDEQDRDVRILLNETDTPLRQIGEGEVRTSRAEREKELRAACGGNSSSSGSSGSGFFGGFCGRGGLAAALGLRRRGGCFTDEFGHHNAGNEQLGAVIVEIDRGTLLIGSGNDAQAVCFVLDCLSFCHHLHIILLDHICVVELDSKLVRCRALERIEGL